MAVTTGKETGTTSNGSSSKPSGGGGDRGGGPGGGSLQAPNRTDPSKGAPASKASTTSAPGKTDKATPAPTSAPGKTDKVGTSEGPEKKPGLAGIQSARQQAAFDKQKDLYTQAGGASTSMRGPSGQKESVKVVDPSRGPNRGLNGTSSQTTKTATGKTDKELGPATVSPTNNGITSRGPNRGLAGTNTTTTKSAPGKTDNIAKQPSSNLLAKGNPQQSLAPGRTDKQLSPSVTRPMNESFIDSLVNKGDYPGSYNASGSILGMQPTAPSLGQVMRQDPMSYMGPRAGTTPARPSTPVDLNASPVGETVQSQMIAERVVNAMKQAAMAQTRAPGLTRGIGDALGPATTPAPQAPAPGKVSLPGPAAPSMPDPRLAAMQEQFERIKMARGQIAAPQTVAPGRTDAVVPQTVAPGRTDVAAPQSVAPGRTDPVTPQTVAPGRTDPEMPQTVAPGRTDMEEASVPQDVPSGPLSSGRSVDDVLQEIALAEAAVNNLGMEEISEPTAQSRAPTEVDIDGYPQSVSPSQDGNYPPDDNFMQDDGQAQDLGELSNRYDYEKARAKEGLTQLAGRLFNAITSGDIRGFTPETNDKRAVNPPSMNRRPQQQAPMSDADAVMVARLLALIKEIEQQGGSQAQADLVNSTFI